MRHRKTEATRNVLRIEQVPMNSILGIYESNYSDLMRPPVGIDAEVDQNKHKKVEKVLNAHGISWTTILEAGQFIGH